MTDIGRELKYERIKFDALSTFSISLNPNNSPNYFDFFD